MIRVTYGVGTVLIELPEGVICTACDQFGFFLWNTYGRTLCSTCAWEWRQRIEGHA